MSLQPDLLRHRMQSPDCRSRPRQAAAAILDHYRREGFVDPARWPAASFVIRDGRRTIAGRGHYSPHPLYYLDDHLDPSASRRFYERLRPLAPLVGCRPDPAGIRDYLCYGFAPAPRTVLAGVRAVAPGSFGIFDDETPAGRWQGFTHRLPPAPDDPAAVFRNRLERLLHEAGAGALLLSGGLDSAVVAAASGSALALYHARFAEVDRRYDLDTPAARAVAAHLGLPYHEIRINAFHALADFDRVAQALDQPLGDPVTLPFYRLFQALSRTSGAKRRYVLTGEGGDQLCGSWSMKPMLVREAYGGGGYCRSRAYLESFHKFPDAWRMLLAPPLREAASGRPEAAIEQAWAAAPGAELRDGIRWVDIQLKGMQHILPRIEAMAAAFGFKPIHPLFDPLLLDLSFVLPADWKYDAGREKVLLRQFAESQLPECAVERPKTGMGVPTNAWFRFGLRPLVWRLLSARRLQRSGLLDPLTVKAILKGDLLPEDGRLRRRGDWLWMLCLLEAWFASLGHEEKMR